MVRIDGGRRIGGLGEGGRTHGASADGMPVCGCVGADPGGEIFFFFFFVDGGWGFLGGGWGFLRGAGEGSSFRRPSAFDDDVRERGGADDFVGEFLARGHHFEVVFAAGAEEVARVDEGFVVCRRSFVGGGVGVGGRQVDGSRGKGVL